MEGDIETQYQIMQAMNKLVTNFKKDGASRKTPDYVQKKIDLLDKYWLEFRSNHEKKLREREDPSHEYFAQELFEQTRQFYNTARESFVKYLTQEQNPVSPVLKPPTFTFEPTPSTSKLSEQKFNPEQGTGGVEGGNQSPFSVMVPEAAEIASNSKIDEMLRKQRSNIKAFQRTVSHINVELLKEKWQFEDALKLLESRWKAVDSLYWDLDSFPEEAEEQYEISYNACELVYNQIKENINTKMWSVSHREKSTPKIEIPTFSGSYEHWTAFKDLFVETIHSNPSLSKAQRMQFLKSKVKGEAEKLIQHLSISSENYETAWEILNRRYNNKKLIFSSHLNSLLGVPNTHHLSAASVKKLHDTTQECINAIKNLGVDTSSWDPILVHLLSQKLDAETLNDYLEALEEPRELPNLADFLNFLEGKFVSWETSRRKPETSKGAQSEPTQMKKKYHSYKAFSARQNKNDDYKSNSLTKENEVALKCPHCNQAHKLFSCKEFLGLQPDEKRKSVAKYNLCKNCLSVHTQGNGCLSKRKCRVCNADHNTLLHDAYGRWGGQTSNNRSVQQNTAVTESKKTTSNNTNHVSQEDVSETLLTTALINVQAKDGSLITLRALLDQGSQTSLITEKAAQRLRIPRGRCKGVISGVGAKESNCKGVIRITCSAIHSDYEFDTDVFIMRNLVNNLPNKSFTKPKSWKFLENITLADPEFNESRPVDILLGADIYSNIIQEGILRQDKSQPVAQQTRLGWILCGTVQTTFQCNVVINNIDDIRQFWSVEDIAEDSKMSQDDLDCLQHYKNTTTRNQEGRYTVELPFIPNFQEKLGASKSMALAQFRQLERKFTKQPLLAESYRQFIHEYQAMGHMVECTSKPTPACYLPHHCVQRADSTTTALRVVFNASAKTSTGHTLNDLMKRGPNLQQDLMALILRWRQYQFAYTADIEKMYRQIHCSTEHQKYQKILWRSSPDQRLREYQLTTVTYGMKAAPFLAMMTLKQLAADEGHKYQNSRAAKALQEEFYMDDLVSGSFTLSSAKQLQEDLLLLLRSGGFNLRKWSSNNEELLQNVNRASSNQASFDFKQAESTKTLGLKWNPKEDTFSFELKIDVITKAGKHTKRSLLSDISKIFDPLGWLAPITTTLKLLFKQVWLSNIQWDDQLPDKISTEWEKVKAYLQNISEFRIQRWYKTGEQDTIQLHGFCDASIKAYACVVYCKIDTYVTLVAAKTRLVPENKKLTLPRLELCGAHLLSSLMQKIVQALHGREIKIYGWTDSTAVLGWIQGNINRWTPFVANRIRQIKDVIISDNWYYIKSADNPADCASRGITTAQLKQHHLWWNGPQFLPKFDESLVAKRSIYVTDQEERKIKQSNVIVGPHSDDVIQHILHRNSDMARAVRILAWVLRITRRQRYHSVYLHAKELDTAKHMIIKYVQEANFSEEINNLRKQEPVHRKSKTLCLNPFLDKDGLLRVGGRLKHANIDEEMKHPLIIPHSSHVTDLIIDQAHRHTFHAGARMTLAHIRRSYWILGGNRAVRKRLLTCITCKKHKAIKQKQMMGDLPEPRSNPSRPFHHTGVDYTGYVDVKHNKGRGAKTSKGYIAVFVCMVTKAVHLELVSDLSSTAFLAALKRMSSRRGKPHHIYSDNGTNFVGANKALQQEQAELRKTFHDEFYAEIGEMGIQWHFNAPAWPSAGGLWEAAVKSLKYHLRRVVGEQKLTFEEYSTLLAQLEACLNSRPLCTITEDPDDLDYLTPSHFLSSGPILTILDTEQDERTRWKRTEKIFEDIWKRWQSEYLAQLSARSKWQRPHENIRVDDVVIIHEPNLPAGRWALGRVTELHPGSDGLVRVVTLKTKTGYIKRPVIKLSVLVSNPKATDQTEKISHKQTAKKKDDQSKCRPGMASNLIATIITLLLFMTSVFGHQQSASPYSLTTIHKALYFDRISNMQFIRDEWKLIVYHDMSPYWDGLTTFEKYLQQITNVCETETKKALCDIIILQLRHAHDELRYYNEMLLNQHIEERTRKRRGLIDGVGYIASSLFGVLDQRFAEQYKQDISLIKKNEEHLALLWKNQTSVVEAEYNLLKRTEASINRQHKVINQHLNNLTKATNILNKELQEQEVMNELALSTIIATNMLAKLKSIQDTIIDTITDIHHGMFSVHLLSPKQLRDQLSIISGQLSRELSLPIENIQTELPKMYHLLKVKTRVTQQYLIFEIRIPLVSRESYDLYQLISIPQQHGNTTVAVVPVSDYIAINLRKDTYLAMTASDIQQCIPYDDLTRLCHSRKPIFQFKSEDSMCIKEKSSNRCLTNTAACRNNWMELSKTNTYLYYCCGQCALRIICEHQITAIQVAKTGVITLDSDCVIKGEDFTVFSHKMLYSEMKTATDLESQQIAPINHIINVSVPEVEINTTDHQASFRYIKEQIEQMKSEKALYSEISSHDIHQYSVIYVLVLGAALTVLVYLCRWLYRRRQRSTDLQSNSELQPPNVPVAARREYATSVVGPPPHTRDASHHQETVELRNFNSILSSIKRHKKIPPVFTKPVSGDSD